MLGQTAVMDADVRQLATQWDEAVRAGVSRFEPVVEYVATNGTVLREGAAPEAVTAAEQRLGLAFPPSYREFLLFSNGAWATSTGVTTMGSELLPVERVRRFDEVDAEYVELWTEASDSLDEPDEWGDSEAAGVDEGVADVWNHSRMRDALVIGVNFDAIYELLVPPHEGDKKVAEWEVWQTGKEGSMAYRSFAHFLRYETEHAAEAPDPAKVEEYAAIALDGESRALELLAEVDGERALTVALEIMEARPQDSARDSAVRVLGLLADPAAIPILRRQLGVVPASECTVRTSVLYALEACGAPDARELWLEESRVSPYDYIRDEALHQAERL